MLRGVRVTLVSSLLVLLAACNPSSPRVEPAETKDEPAPRQEAAPPSAVAPQREPVQPDTTAIANVAPRRKPVKPDITALADVAPMRLVALPGGEFVMGSPETEAHRHQRDEHQFRVRVDPFALATHEVTLAQWEAVMGTRPNDCKAGCEDDHPVQNISWDDACRFISKLTERENAARETRGEEPLSPCYIETYSTWSWADRNCTGFRLPTEAEWEYAARADTTEPYYFRHTPLSACLFENLADQSTGDDPIYVEWPCNDGYKRLAPVGSFLPNPFGLYDILGNVEEWVFDSHGEYPRDTNGRVVANYVAPEGGPLRTYRGCSYKCLPEGTRVAKRPFGYTYFVDSDRGFRVARGLVTVIAKDFVAELLAHDRPTLVGPFAKLELSADLTIREARRTAPELVNELHVMSNLGWFEYKGADYPGVSLRTSRFGHLDHEPSSWFVGTLRAVIDDAELATKLREAWGEPVERGTRAYWFDPAAHLRCILSPGEDEELRGRQVLDCGDYLPLAELIGTDKQLFGFEGRVSVLGMPSHGLRKRWGVRVFDDYGVNLMLPPTEFGHTYTLVWFDEDEGSGVITSFEVSLDDVDSARKLLDAKFGPPTEDGFYRERPYVTIDSRSLLVSIEP